MYPCSLQVRLNLLSTLLDEAYGFLHRFLCASVLGRKVFTLPFSRDVDITVAGVRAMRSCLQYCQQVRRGGTADWGVRAMRSCLQYCRQVRRLRRADMRMAPQFPSLAPGGGRASRDSGASEFAPPQVA